ncbi:DNA-binding transcriptional regulator, LysR family [Paenibacillus catalpae]|uniref:DNA-binding transcriptional regulator, LysR family n=1 Tax=Paenibacillus catalpae TaxID=1045775 RepID=A0A1I1VCN3_9BACL|nr:LysR family transcriptional regulator [Paenibacillus catalpae]SFD80737.1 DNA-binding transcriptional regulator, LysR family [Paenibacillus catalpae]
MNEKDAVILQYVAEEQSLTKAAERLYMTQPALTYRIQQMEREFGVPIIMKHAKGTYLTPEGEALAAFAKKMRDEMNAMKDYLLNMSRQVKGTFRLGVASYYGLYKLPPLLRKFKDLYPEVQFNVTCALSAEILDLLTEQEIHVGIVRGNYQWPEAKYLLHDEPICLISREPIDLDKLPELPQILYSEPKSKVVRAAASSLGQTIQTWWHEHYSVPPLIAMQADAYETCKELVKQGLGYSIVPGVFVTPEDGVYSLELKLKNGESIRRNTWMLYREHTRELAIVDKFVDFMKSEH